MKKEENKTNKVVTATTPVAQEAQVAEENVSLPEYTGYEEVLEHNGVQPIYRNRKVNLSDSEVKDFLKGADPAIYFKSGRVPAYCKKAFGELLRDDDEENLVFKKVFSNYPGLLMFYNRKHGIYTILVPKIMSMFELDVNGDYIEDHVVYDIRTVVFSGVGSPKSFEEGHFTKIANNIKARLEDVRRKRNF